MAELLYRSTMKTSSRIALQFTLWVAIISWILLGILNTVFMYWWIRSETQNLTQFVVLQNLQPRNPITDSLQRQERVIAFDENIFKPDDFPSFRWIKRFRLFDGRRWILWRSNNYHVLFDVTQNINRQLWLLYISAISRFSVLIWSFVFGRFFVQRSLRDLRNLARNVRHRDVTQATWWLMYSHLPEHDEINSIAKAIDWLEQRIQSHYSHLRGFVWHVSHELKTPLMVMRSDLDLADRTKEYSTISTSLRGSIVYMQSMVDTLLTLTRLQSQESIERLPVHIHAVVQETIADLQKKYANSSLHIKLTSKVRSEDTVSCNEALCRILITNVVDNACKYNKQWNSIEVHLSNDVLCVQNTGDISQDIIDNMRTPFRQADKNRTDWVGIWLSLVKEIVRLHKRKVEYSSSDGIISCNIHFTS